MAARMNIFQRSTNGHINNSNNNEDPQLTKKPGNFQITSPSKT